MKTLSCAVLFFLCTALHASAAGLELSIRDGRVTLDAQDVTLRQILTEWARIGKTRIINIEHGRAGHPQARRRSRKAGARDHPPFGAGIHGGAARDVRR
jgi:hypothetical protein